MGLDKAPASSARVVKRTARQKRGRARRGAQFYLPENLDVAALLPEHLRKYADCGRYYVHLIVRQRVFMKWDAETFVPLKAEYLRKVIPRHIEKPLRTAMIDSG